MTLNQWEVRVTVGKITVDVQYDRNPGEIDFSLSQCEV